jgi:hypothetical protein
MGRKIWFKGLSAPEERYMERKYHVCFIENKTLHGFIFDTRPDLARGTEAASPQWR